METHRLNNIENEGGWHAIIRDVVGVVAAKPSLQVLIFSLVCIRVEILYMCALVSQF